jgi:hypothetical protein
MGGYCLQNGVVWRLQLPESLLGRATLNALEFLAAFVRVLVEFSCGAEWTDADVVLSQGDSVFAAKWLASSSFDDNCPKHLAIARSFADFCFIGELLRRLPSTKLLPTQPKPSATAVGAAMNASSGASGDDSTLFSDDSDHGRDLKPSPASPPRLERDDWTSEELQRIALEPRPELFVPPSIVWLRPIGLTDLRVPSTTDTENLNHFWPSS